MSEPILTLNLYGDPSTGDFWAEAEVPGRNHLLASAQEQDYRVAINDVLDALDWAMAEEYLLNPDDPDTRTTQGGSVRVTQP